MKKYKILALPGWENDGFILKKHMGELHDLISKYVEIEYLDPPYDVSKSMFPLPPLLDTQGRKVYRWGNYYLDMSEDIERIKNRILENPNIIGLMGFSQGVFIIGEIGQLAYTDSRLAKQLRFLICFSSNGIKPRRIHYDKKHLITIPTLQTIGSKDFAYLESIIQTTEYLNSQIIWTESTHRVPILSYDQKIELANFISDKLDQPKL
ncbi:unnamed protein product (macronuclear) [Paramecium tetraurelia]|uniref:Serine hydrolase domain-containing protein n=1 Tax=Paramecium tetraurelia TaxID=5888 RepID=A0EA70_PARTE|nr:uncharacterized protein GSPATT00024919001 [Paramecium tetraurelia]CAK92187.1 unnamed protein product [Paramecium tetraurelia]|eukprot:XP_001459584.1 hypothetical protein (macronuclear) [Paramecium tetraurelia strain d4-2]